MKNWKEKIKDEPTIFLLRKVWKYAEGHRKIFVLFIFLSIIAHIALLTPPWLLGKLLNEIQQNGLNEDNIVFVITLLLGFLLIDLIFWTFHGPSRVLEFENAFRSKRKYMEKLLFNALNSNITWHSHHDSGDTIDKINNASRGLTDFARNIYEIIAVSIQVIGTTIILITFNFYIGTLALLMVIFTFFVLLKFDAILVKKYAKLNIYGNKISSNIFDVLSNITSIKILGIEKITLKNLNKILWIPLKTYMEAKTLNEKKWFFGAIMFTLVVIVPIILFIIFEYKGNTIIAVGTISMLYMYLNNLRGVYYSFAAMYGDFMMYKTKIQNAEEIENSFSKNKKIQKTEIKNWNKFKIKNLNFRYLESEDKNNHLDNIDLEIQKGEKIAFIGKSGSGKTTFLKVLHGLYDNAESEIAFKDKSFQKTNFTDLNLKTMLVPQEPELFSSSIRENVTFGLDYSDEEIKKVLNLASFSDVLEQLPKGLDSVVNEKGVNLSGGQKQRLALARALLFSDEKEIILLDESTSSVDPKSEVEIYKNIFKEFSGKTFLASIHKMNLLKYFDRIVIFENGKIIDEGTFEELYNRNENFKKQWDEYVKEK